MVWFESLTAQLFPGCLGLTDGGYVGEVLGTARGEFVRDEVFGGDVAGGNLAVDHDRQAACVCARKIDPVDSLDDFEADGRNAESGHCLPIGKVIDLEIA
jgi:hypothetical protein